VASNLSAEGSGGVTWPYCLWSPCNAVSIRRFVVAAVDVQDWLTRVVRYRELKLQTSVSEVAVASVVNEPLLREIEEQLGNGELSCTSVELLVAVKRL